MTNSTQLANSDVISKKVNYSGISYTYNQAQWCSPSARPVPSLTLLPVQTRWRVQADRQVWDEVRQGDPGPQGQDPGAPAVHRGLPLRPPHPPRHVGSAAAVHPQAAMLAAACSATRGSLGHPGVSCLLGMQSCLGAAITTSSGHWVAAGCLMSGDMGLHP